MEPQTVACSDCVVLHRQGFERVAFLFVAKHSGFPHLKTWQAFFAGASTAALYSLYVLAPVAHPRGSVELSKLHAIAKLRDIGATVLTMPTKSGLLDLSSLHFVRAIRVMLRAALDDAAASRFCLLPDWSTPIYPFNVIHRKLLADSRSSVDACNRPSDAQLPHNRGQIGALWVVLTRKHALMVAGADARVDRELALCAEKNAPCQAAGHFIPTVLHGEANETDCLGGMIRVPTKSIAKGQQPEVAVTADLLHARSKRGCPSDAGGDRARHRVSAVQPHCPVFLAHKWSPITSLRTFCNVLYEDLQKARFLAGGDAVVASLSSVHCRTDQVRGRLNV